jgi:hypothetical protein
MGRLVHWAILKLMDGSFGVGLVDQLAQFVLENE